MMDVRSSVDVADRRGSALHVGYILTHYPKIAQTFIADEIDAVRQTGTRLTTFAMNAPGQAERSIPGVRTRMADTVYLKQNPLMALADLCLFAVRHPVAMARISWTAIASAAGHPARTMRRLAHLAQAATVARNVRNTGIDHLHAHFGLAPATIAWLASRMLCATSLSTKFSFTIHGFHDFVDPQETRLDLKAAAAACVVCISDYTKSQLCLQTPSALWCNFKVMRCGIDLQRLSYVERGKSAAAVRIIAVGRLSAEKGFAILIDAVARLRMDGLAVNLRLIGEGPERAMLEQAVAGLGLQDAVTFVGELDPDGVQRELASADIFCLSSFNEGLPISIMEAMATGLPVVTTWIAGIPELAEHGVTALCVPPGRADELANALQRLCDDPELRTQLSMNARARVCELHDLRKSGSAMATLFAETVAR